MTDATPRRAVEHPFDRQRRAFFGIPGLVLLAALFASGGAATTIETRNAAIAAYDAALAEQLAVVAQVQGASSDYRAKAEQLSEIADAVRPVTALSGEPIPADATTALEAARQAAVAAAERSFTAIGTADEDLDRLRVAEIEARTAELATQTASASAIAEQLEAASSEVDAASTALGQALGDYLTAVVQHGADLVKAHSQAPQDRLDAFRSAIDALPDAEVETLPIVLQSAIDAAARLG